MTTMRSQSRSASSTSWVTSTTVVPPSRTRRTTSQVWRRPTGSRFWVSSSRNTSRGRPTRARATNSRWRSPPDRAPKGRRHRAAELPLLGQLAERAGRRVERREQPQRLADPDAVGQGGVLELGADPAAQPVAGAGPGRGRAPDRAAVGPAQALEDLDRRSSCRPRSCPAARTARPPRRRRTRRAGPASVRSASPGRRRRRPDAPVGRSSSSTAGRAAQWLVGHGPIVRPGRSTPHRPTGARWAPSRGGARRSRGRRRTRWRRPGPARRAWRRSQPTWVFTVASLT